MAKKALIRIGIVIVVTCVMCFSDWSFAAEWDNFNIMGFTLNSIVAILSWIWIFFAKLAGTFLTNKWIYGEILWIDALLWKYWNVMKNIANFWLWFYFVYVIFKWLINQWKEDITQKLKDILVWLLIAWVWIQASWFLLAVLIDVSNILTYSVWWLPIHILGKDAGENKDFWNPYVFQAYTLIDTLNLAPSLVFSSSWISKFMSCILPCILYSFYPLLFYINYSIKKR